MEVYLVRHTTPDVAKGVIYGQSDLNVTSHFELEAAAVRQKLPSHIEAFYSSPLQRCMKLTRYLTTKSIREDRRLLEISFGDWEGKKWDDIEPSALNHWMKNYVSVAPPNGESTEQMLSRVKSFWIELQSSDYEIVAIIAHAGVIRLISSIILNTDLKDAFDLKIEYGDVFKTDPKLKKWEAI